jgi:16S rRNA processing protein RimM
VSNNYISVGRVAGVFGYQGWLKVIIYSGITERFEGVKVIYFRDGDHFEGQILDDYRIQGDNVLLKIRQVDSRERAREFANSEVYLPESHILELPEDQYYIHDIIGLRVLDEEGNRVGIIKEVISAGASDVFVIQADKREILIPAVSEFIKEVDLEKKRVIVRMWEEL